MPNKLGDLRYRRQIVIFLLLLPFFIGWMKVLPLEAVVLPMSYAGIQYAFPLTRSHHAWMMTEGNPMVKVAVIDTGLDLEHPEFVDAHLDPLSYDVANDQVGLAYVEDDNGHGTRVTSVIINNHRDGVGYSGIAPRITLMVIKANYAGSSTYNGTDVSNGIRYAAEHGAHIINISAGSIYFNQTMLEAIDDAFDLGTLTVAAVGNSKTDTPNYPAAYDNVIAVSAVQEQGVFDSNYSNYGTHVDVAAPGTRIRMARPNNPTNLYSSLNGTSFAAPHVTGVLALMKSYDFSLTASQLRDRLYATAHDRGDLGWDMYYGHGIVDAYAAITTYESCSTMDAEQYATYFLSETENKEGICSSIEWNELSQTFDTLCEGAKTMMRENNFNLITIADALARYTYLLQLPDLGFDDFIGLYDI